MRPRGRHVCTVGLLLAWTTPAAEDAREMRHGDYATSGSVRAGVDTPAPADAGGKIYFERCAACHGDDLAGVERAPALAGAGFVESGHLKTLRQLIERIDTVPPAEPVVPAQAVELSAFLLRESEMPSGPNHLPADRGRLGEITFERAKP